MSKGSTKKRVGYIGSGTYVRGVNIDQTKLWMGHSDASTSLAGNPVALLYVYRRTCKAKHVRFHADNRVPRHDCQTRTKCTCQKELAVGISVPTNCTHILPVLRFDPNFLQCYYIIMCVGQSVRDRCETFLSKFRKEPKSPAVKREYTQL